MSSREEQILKLAEAGQSLVDIGKQFNISRERVRQILADMGYQRSDRVKNAAKKLAAYASKYPVSIKDLSVKFDMSTTTVCRILTRREVQRDVHKVRSQTISSGKRKGRVRLTEKMLRHNYVDRGLSQTAIAKRSGYAQTTVSTLLRKYGIER